MVFGKKKKEEKASLVPAPVAKGFDLLFNNNKSQEMEPKSIQEKTLEKALDELFSVDGIDLKSDINNQQISAITRGYIFADVYKCPYMNDLIKHILELSVSKNRQGRAEFVKVLQSTHPVEDEAQPLRIMKRRLLE